MSTTKDMATIFGKNLEKELRKLKAKPFVKTGFPKKDFQKKKDVGGLTVGEVAVFLNFGTETIPPRPFITEAHDENQKVMLKYIEQLKKKIVEGKMTVERALELMGLRHCSQIVKKINSNMPPPNALSTIARKGSDHTLVDTGQMRQVAANGYQVVMKPGEE